MTEASGVTVRSNRTLNWRPKPTWILVKSETLDNPLETRVGLRVIEEEGV
jgi:hypothetical protein